MGKQTSVAVRSSAAVEWTCAPMAEQHYSCDVLVVGGGPAGIAASACASENGQQVIIVDDNPALGGQIWRGNHSRHPGDAGSSSATQWIARLKSVQMIAGATVFYANSTG